MSEYVEIKRIIRPMRGKSRSFLALGEDQHFYVVKQGGNATRNRHLVNECLADVILRSLAISIPDIRVVRIKFEELEHVPEGLSIHDGLHFGSRSPVDPTKQTIYDFLPRKLLRRVSNLREFAVVFAVDVWLCNADSRQQVFVFETTRDGSKELRSFFIDNDEILSGSAWRLNDHHVAMRWRDTLSLANLPHRDLCLAASKAITKIDLDIIHRQALCLSQPWMSQNDNLVFSKMLNYLDVNRINLERRVDLILTACSRITSTANAEMSDNDAQLLKARWAS